MLNDGSKAAGDVVEAVSDASETFSKVVKETSENIDKGLDNIEAKKQRVENLTGQKLDITQFSNHLTNASNAAKKASNMQTGGFKKLANEGEQIGGRISDSLAEFSDPISYHTGILKGGHNKTKKSTLVNGKNIKSRRVRFSM